MPRVGRADHDAGRQPLLGRRGCRCRCGRCTGCISSSRPRRRRTRARRRGRPRSTACSRCRSRVDQHDAVLGALVGGAGRAHRDAGRLLAMQARVREMHGARALALAFLERMDAVEPHPPGALAIGVEIGQRRRVAAAVPFLAGGRAGMAADADIEIDDEAELFLARRRGRSVMARAPAVRPAP